MAAGLQIKAFTAQLQDLNISLQHARGDMKLVFELLYYGWWCKLATAFCGMKLDAKSMGDTVPY